MELDVKFGDVEVSAVQVPSWLVVTAIVAVVAIIVVKEIS